MVCMVVTLEVSKLSGWLNANARCRESKEEHTVWGEVQSTGRQEAAGDCGASSVHRRGLDYTDSGQGSGRSAL